MYQWKQNSLLVLSCHLMQKKVEIESLLLFLTLRCVMWGWEGPYLKSKQMSG